MPGILLGLAGDVEGSLWNVFADLPLSAGTCYDVHRRWQYAIQCGGGGGRLSVSLKLDYYSTTYNKVETLAAEIRELERQGTPSEIIVRTAHAGLKHFKKTTASVAAGHMSIAEVFQLAFALEHLAPTPPHLPLRFISAASGDYDLMMHRNHAHELMTTSTRPDAQIVRKLWALMAEWLPGGVANFTTRFLLGRHACRWEFRRDLRLAAKNLSHLKGGGHPGHSQPSPRLPYTGPPVVWGILPAVEKFMHEEHARRRGQGTSTAIEKS